jgi:hypothetical protein
MTYVEGTRDPAEMCSILDAEVKERGIESNEVRCQRGLPRTHNLLRARLEGQTELKTDESEVQKKVSFD